MQSIARRCIPFALLGLKWGRVQKNVYRFLTIKKTKSSQLPARTLTSYTDRRHAKQVCRDMGNTLKSQWVCVKVFKSSRINRQQPKQGFVHSHLWLSALCLSISYRNEQEIKTA